MRHAKAFRKFSRTASHRRAMFRNMTTSLFMNERIETTVEKAKDLRRVAEKLITMAGEDNLASRRKAYSYLMDKPVVHKLFTEIGPKYRARPGGYTRIVRTRTRPGDAAELAVLQLVQEEIAEKTPKKKRKGVADKAETKAAAVPVEEALEEPEVKESVAESEETGPSEAEEKENVDNSSEEEK